MPDRMDLFLNKPLIRDYLKNAIHYPLTVKKPKLLTRETIPQDIRFLFSRDEGVITDPLFRMAWFHFITKALGQLVEIGAADPTHPNYSLWDAKY